MIPFTLTGLTAEHFAAARKDGADLRSSGPGPEEFWVLLFDAWRVAPRQSMPLLLGVHDLGTAARAAAMVGGVLRELTMDELRDLLELLEDEGGASCR